MQRFPRVASKYLKPVTMAAEENTVLRRRSIQKLKMTVTRFKKLTALSEGYSVCDLLCWLNCVVFSPSGVGSLLSMALHGRVTHAKELNVDAHT